MTRAMTLRLGIDASALLIARKNGYENYATHLLAAIADLEEEALHGLDVRLYAYAGNRLADPALLADHPAFRRFPCRVWRPRRGFGLALPLMAAIDRLDWLHLPVHLWSRRLPCRVVTTFHDACGHRWLEHGPPYPLVQALEDMARDQVALSDHFIAVSRSAKQDLAAFYGVAPDRIDVVYHGIDTAFTPDAAGAEVVRDVYQLPPYLLSVNQLQGNKNYPRLLTAFAALKERHDLPHTLVIAGREGWGSDEIHAEIERSGLGSSVRVLGFVPQEHLAGLYASADLVVNASLCEGFGLPVLEALASGAVVASSNATSLPEAGGEAVFYFDPLDLNDMVTVLWTALSDKAARAAKRAGAAGHLASFTWRRAALETVAVYRRLETAAYA